MRFLPLLLAAGLLCAAGARAATDYQPGPDSLPQPGVPRGELLAFTFDHSRIYPGTTRHYWIYVPAQYRPEKPACLYVGQDGVLWNAPTVFDNLIARGEMPVTIGVFIEPGVVPSLRPATALDRYNRSYEYDSLGDAYVRFLLDELLPDAAAKHASDGRPIRFSGRAADRAIGGQSSGAICAFTAAWERPESFSRVFSAIGTYVGLRGGDIYPTLIRQFEPKPIRLFLQDGSHDQNIYGGDWWMANQMMERALTFAGYEVNHVWGDDGHSGRQAAAIFPEAMRWLWQGWPAAVPEGRSGNEYLRDILIPGQGWEVARSGLHGADGIAANARGEVFFCDTGAARMYRINLDGTIVQTQEADGHVTGQGFSPDGRLYAVNLTSLVAYAPDSSGPPAVLAAGFRGNDLAVAHNGDVYITNPTRAGAAPSKVLLVRAGSGRAVAVDSGILFPNGITLSADQSLLYVDDSRSHWVYSFVIRPDGTLADKQRYGHMYSPDQLDASGADGMHSDRDGRVYATSSMGIQVFDQAGRCECIIPTPNRHVVSVCLGGPNFDILYAGCGDTLYRRRVRVTGANGWDLPNKPPKPHL